MGRLKHAALQRWPRVNHVISSARWACLLDPDDRTCSTLINFRVAPKGDITPVARTVVVEQPLCRLAGSGHLSESRQWQQEDVTNQALI
jgi:hypothetical protein